MRQIKLYTGAGATRTPTYVDGRTTSNYVRLVAEDGMMITDDLKTATCIDVPATEINKWRDCPYFGDDDDIPAEDALGELLEAIG